MFKTWDDVRIDIMRITKRFNLDFVDKVTLREYSMYQYAFELSKIDDYETQATNSFFNLLGQNLEGNVSTKDIYDANKQRLSLFGQYVEHTPEEIEKRNYFYELNKQLDRGAI